MKNEQRKIYLPLYSKGSWKGYERVVCERWVGDWTNCNILAALLSHSAWLLNRGSWVPIALCWVLVLSTASNLQLDWLQLPELPVASGYIIVWHSPASCERRICIQFNPSTVKVIPWYLLPNAPVPLLTAGSEVNMLHSVKCFQVLLFDTNNSIKHQSFVYSQLNDHIVLFTTIQFRISTM